MSIVVKPLPRADLDHVLCHAERALRSLTGCRLFLTGATGFFGMWLLESLAYAHDTLGVSVSATILSRDPQAFARRVPHLAQHPAFSFVTGDVRDFKFPHGHFDHVIHAAAETTAGPVGLSPADMFSVISGGTQRVLDFAVRAAVGNVLLVSSGAVYGRQPSDMALVPETWSGAPSLCDPASAYGEGKRVAELLCAIAHRQCGLSVRIARCFAFVGPHLPLDAHFAIGNFIGDVLHRRHIHVGGDGTPWRSYLHAADLAVWLWTILHEGHNLCPYNVGSDQALTIKDLAQRVAAHARGPEACMVKVARAPAGADARRYVPEISRARSHLGLEVRIGLDEAIRRTLAWHADGSPTPT